MGTLQDLVTAGAPWSHVASPTVFICPSWQGLESQVSNRGELWEEYENMTLEIGTKLGKLHLKC